MDLKELKLLQKKQLSRHPWEVARLEVVLTLLRQFMSRRLKSRATVIDIGCGDVWVAEQLALVFRSAKFLAVDQAFDEGLLRSLRANLCVNNVELYPSLESAVELRENPADIVLLLDVIEHIADDEMFLHSLYQSKMLSESVQLLITVPAFQELYCSHDTFLAHYRRYNLKQLRSVIEGAGFEVLEQGYFFTSLLVPRLVQVQLEKFLQEKAKPQKGLAAWKGNSLKSTLIKQVLLIDFKISQLLHKVGFNLPGLSCYSVCRKRQFY